MKQPRIDLRDYLPNGITVREARSILKRPIDVEGHPGNPVGVAADDQNDKLFAQIYEDLGAPLSEAIRDCPRSFLDCIWLVGGTAGFVHLKTVLKVEFSPVLTGHDIAAPLRLRLFAGHSKDSGSQKQFAGLLDALYRELLGQEVVLPRQKGSLPIDERWYARRTAKQVRATCNLARPEDVIVRWNDDGQLYFWDNVQDRSLADSVKIAWRQVLAVQVKYTPLWLAATKDPFGDDLDDEVWDPGDLDELTEGMEKAGAFVIPKEKDEAAKKVLRAIALRQGQTVFRNGLLAAYDSRCIVTGCNADSALEAAHIIPYCEGEEETNHAQNGLLLRADIHTLFDRGKIAIDTSKWTVVLDEELMETTYSDLAGCKVAPKVKTICSAEALDVHRRVHGL